MNFQLLFLTIESAYILAAILIGLTLTKRGRPYRYVLPSLHVIFAILITAGVVSDLLVGMPHYQILSQVTLLISALALLCIIIIGIVMLVTKTRNLKLVSRLKLFVIVFVLTFGMGRILVMLNV